MPPKHRPSDTVRPDHPLLVAATAKDCPPGFVLDRQIQYVKGIDTVRKKAVNQHGKDNVVVLAGHYELFTGRHKELPRAEFLKAGCRVYVRKQEVRKRRELPGGGEAGPPDLSRECACGARPVEPTTGKCAACLWGDYKNIGGDW